MNRRIGPLVLAGATFVVLGCGGREAREDDTAAHTTAASAPPQQVSWTAVEQALGRTGALQPGDVYKFGLPRSDLTVVVDRVPLKPALALGSWVAFKATSSGAVVTGDLVLRAAEVNPVLRALREHGIEVTAVHNHMLDEEPRLFFMHFWAVGDGVRLAEGLRAALDLVGGARLTP